MILKVARRGWNRVELAAATFGLSVEPDAPRAVGVTEVEITGSLEKLQQCLNAIGAGPDLARVVDRLPMHHPYGDDSS